MSTKILNDYSGRHALVNYRRFAAIALCLAFVVVMLGAYTRITDSGLGCPDWPGCYGHMIPKASAKAWTEMIHRYFAGSLGLVVLCLAIVCSRAKPRSSLDPMLAWLAVAAIIAQALLGMWTVTLKLYPLVVTAHLLGGMTMIALLTWLLSSSLAKPTSSAASFDKFWLLLALLGLIALAGQIFLGAWTSANYAGLACHGFPSCNGLLHPVMNWQQAFHWLPRLGANYEGGTLEMPARVAIHMAHRYGAVLVVGCFAALLITMVCCRRFRTLRPLLLVIAGLLTTQVALGISNVSLTLPVWSAVLHNGVAALLVACVVRLIHQLLYYSKGKSSQ